MRAAFNPWNPDHMTVEEPPFMDLLAEARAALDAPGATAADVKRRYRRALAAGSPHLDAPPTIDVVVAVLDEAHLPSPSDDDGPFE